MQALIKRKRSASKRQPLEMRTDRLSSSVLSLTTTIKAELNQMRERRQQLMSPSLNLSTARREESWPTPQSQSLPPSFLIESELRQLELSLIGALLKGLFLLDLFKNRSRLLDQSTCQSQRLMKLRRSRSRRMTRSMTLD